MSKPKPLKWYIMCRTVTFQEYADRVAESTAEAQRMAMPIKRSPRKETKWQVIGKPKHIEGPT
jgi:hypothetical protein